AVKKAPRSHALTGFIQDLHVMVRVSPIQTDVPHTCASFRCSLLGGIGSFYNGCSKQRPSNHRLAQECCQGKRDLFLPVKPCGEKKPFPRQGYRAGMNPADPWLKGLKNLNIEGEKTWWRLPLSLLPLRRFFRSGLRSCKPATGRRGRSGVIKAPSRAS